MFDLPDATDVAEICAKIYQADGVVSAVCHGTAGEFKPLYDLLCMLFY